MAEISQLVRTSNSNDSDRYNVCAVDSLVENESDQRPSIPTERGVHSDEYMDVPRTFNWQLSFGVNRVRWTTKCLDATVQSLPAKHARACASKWHGMYAWCINLVYRLDSALQILGELTATYGTRIQANCNTFTACPSPLGLMLT